MGFRRQRGTDRGLDRYVAAISDVLGVDEQHRSWDICEPAGAYLGLPERFALFPDRESALIWDERHGWASAVAALSGDRSVMMAYLGGEVLAEPADVIDFARRLVRGDNVGELFPPELDPWIDLRARLAAYTQRRERQRRIE